MTALREMPEGLSSEKKLELFLTDLARRTGKAEGRMQNAECRRALGEATSWDIEVVQH